jgi:hypothetical protein
VIAGIAITALTEDMLMMVPARPRRVGALFDHLPGGGLSGEENPLQVDLDHPIEVLLPQLEEVAGVDDAGIGDHRVDPPEGRHRGCDQGVDLGLVTDVAGNEDGVRAAGLNLLGGLFAALHLHVRQHHLRAFRGEALCAGQADSGGGPGHDGHLVF